MKSVDWRKEPPFITTKSGDGNYEVMIKVKSAKQMHDAHDLVMRAFEDSNVLMAAKEWTDENQG